MAKSFFERLTGSQKAPEPAHPPRERVMPQAKKEAAREPEEAREEVAAADPEEEGQLTVDIFDDGDNIVIQAILGGVKLDDIDVQVTDDAVTVRGRRGRSHEVRDESFYYRELYWGSFSRSIILPQEVISDEAEATMKEGLLTVTLPKRDRNKAQKLRVKSA